ncbi:leucine-rich repeat-containing protein 15-like [Schistocerca nitens]|uniref:leucine-rich repeat-containing protein 15-like n=1 Tax=Schistocerca nitens TaxID=7011 RepID=UPI002117D63E|nr:leucine-rich repeat-containing protein 15-like [Schistocerca nitens]
MKTQSGSWRSLAAVLVALLAVLAVPCLCELPELECPEECDCHYFRINWVTDCSGSNLTAVPTLEEGLSINVYILNMNDNDLSEVQTFPPGIKLRTLEIAGNNLTELKREYVQGLGYLLDADFSSNKIARVDPDAFRDSPGFITLDLRRNRLQPVDSPFLVSRTLMTLDLSECGLTRLSPQFFTNLTSLSRLDLSGNPLGTLLPGILDPLTVLETLYLSNCNLSHLSDTAFAQLAHLKTLDMSYNRLTLVDWTLVLGPMRLLETLILRRSAITYLPADAFANNTYLRNLILGENELRDLDVGTTLGHNLLYLDTLDLTNCHLHGPLAENPFTNATKLRTLMLSGNHLSSEVLGQALEPLARLQRLYLSNCSLTQLPQNTFDNLTSLHELDISSNPLNDAFTGILSPLESLEVLNMANSNLSHISANSFSKMTHLKRLVLSNNPLTDLEYGLFQNLTKLEVLELNDCGLQHPPDAQVFSNDQSYTNLQELRLAGNPLIVEEGEPLLPRQFSGLRVLDISRCNITQLPRDLFVSTPNLTTLILRGNLLGSRSGGELKADFLETIPSLEVLDLSYCNLSKISPRTFAHSPNLSTLRLTGNPWKCDCYIADMWNWANVGKGNLAILEGFTVPPETKPRRKGLLCHYEPGKQRPRAASRIRHRELSNERTWARFVREAGCELTPPARGPAGRRERRSARQAGGHGALRPAFALPTAAALLGLAAGIGAFSFLRSRRHAKH